MTGCTQLIPSGGLHPPVRRVVRFYHPPVGGEESMYAVSDIDEVVAVAGRDRGPFSFLSRMPSSYIKPLFIDKWSTAAASGGVLPGPSSPKRTAVTAISQQS